MPKTICYTSLYTNPISPFNLELLFHQTRLNNNSHNIKGVLVSKNDKFFQILEGNESVIDNLFDAIKTDSRHHKINEILITDIPSYSFKDFGTGYNTINNLESLSGLQVYLNSPSINNLSNASLFTDTIRKFFK